MEEPLRGKLEHLLAGATEDERSLSIPSFAKLVGRVTQEDRPMKLDNSLANPSVSGDPHDPLNNHTLAHRERSGAPGYSARHLDPCFRWFTDDIDVLRQDENRRSLIATAIW